MSLSSLLFLGACFCMYKLGAFNARNPGQLWEWVKLTWRWMQDSGTKS